MRGVHDLGGQPIDEEVDRAEHAQTFFEKRVDALMRLLADPSRGVIRVDELRRGVETLPEKDYFGYSYYERWIHSIRLLLLEKGVVSEDELNRRIEGVRKRLAAESPR